MIMGDWTTKVISKHVGIDLHPDLDSFPTKLSTINPYNNHMHGILLNKEETYKLMLVLIDYFEVSIQEKSNEPT
jgi:hypothetical protein